MKFTTVNGKTAMLLRTINYKNHVIEKVNRYGMEYYTIDKAGQFWYLKDAKSAIDKEV